MLVCLCLSVVSELPICHTFQLPSLLATLIAKDEQFLTNAYGQPVSSGDVICLANQKRLMPGKTFDEYCQRIQNEPDTFGKEASVSRAAILEENESREGCSLPVFIPSSEVAESVQFGHQIYTKAILLSDSDLVRETKKTGKDLGLTPFCSEWQGNGNPVQFFVVSMVGLPADLLLSAKRIKLFQTTFVKSDKLWLTADTQLSKSQGKDVVGYLTEKYTSKKRPAGLVSPSSLQSLDDLKDLAAILESKRLEQLAAQGESGLQVEPGAGSNLMLAGLDDDDNQSGKKKKKKLPPAHAAKKDGQTGHTPLSLMDDTSTRAPSNTARSLRDTEPSQTTQLVSSKKSDSSKRSGAVEQFQDMDAEIKQVAELHISTAPSRMHQPSAWPFWCQPIS